MSDMNNLFKEICKIIIETASNPKPDWCHETSITETHDASILDDESLEYQNEKN